MDINWGDAPSWVSAIGTVIGLIFIALTVKAQTQQLHMQEIAYKDEHQKQSDARLYEYSRQFSFWIEDSRKPPLIHFVNASIQPVYNVTVHLADETGQRVMLHGSDDVSFGFKCIPHGRFEQALPVDRFALNANSEVCFDDAAGVRWERKSNGEMKVIDRISKYPERWHTLPVAENNVTYI